MHQLAGIAIALSVLLAGTGSGFAENASDTEAVRASNQAYYAALSARDLQAMEQVWSRSPGDVNIAPPIRPTAHVG